ncbi:MAG: hypothetical protein QOF84_5811 [Streptomyces sp.]|jgi:hypothetical protein|nr:hypothetical protein [Streptomyces sp.]
MARTDHPGSSLAALAGLLADDTRATMCLALLDGRAWTAGELARHARVAPSTATATEHLTRLVAGGLLAEERRAGTATYASRTRRPPSSSRTSPPTPRRPPHRRPVRSGP